MKSLLIIALFCTLCFVSAQLPSEEQNILAHEPAAAQDVNTELLAAEHQDTALIESTFATDGPTGRRPTIPLNKQPKDKLDVALAAIKQDIIIRSRQLQEEQAWVGEVNKITARYNRKVKRVELDIKKTRQDVKSLFRKKKQIENLKIQRQLESKLKDAQTDLATLSQALAHVNSKRKEFDSTKNEIKKTIIGIHGQLAKLRGDKKPKLKK